MADWKLPVSYNYSPSYHAYAYGLMYPPGSEQTHPNLSWAEAAYNHSGVTGGYYSAPAPPPQQSPPRSPEDVATNNGHYPGSVLYFADSQTHTQNGRLFLSHNRTGYDERPKDCEPASSDAPSDSEAHTPDSWSSVSSREGCLPQTNPASWTKKERDDELDRGSPTSSELVSSSLTVADEEPVGMGRDCLPPISMALSPPAQTETPPRKTKARTAFSEGQMSALTHRFNVQRYLTPAEMKTLAGLTGLTYKQVKTWFQNRRMKLKRHQKDNSWVSERYPNNCYPSTPTPHSQTEAPTLIQGHYSNPQFREAVFKKSPPQTPMFYPSYPRPHSSPQAPTRPQGNWPLPPAVTHYEYPNPTGYMTANGNTSINSDDGNPVEVGTSPTRMTMVHGATQWS